MINADYLGTDTNEISGPPVKGFFAFILWRAAYWTKQVSINNKILILMHWFKSAVFGRDISRF
jgi:NADH dehydrogenase FAD-containing subunit